jgi:4'-phosphopantetheinyl transferase
VSARETDVIVLDPDAPGAFDFGRAWSVLDGEEQARASRFRREKDRTAFVAAHALLRTTLAGYLGLEPAGLKFYEGRYGRPELALGRNEQRLSFSLSHTDGLVGCAVSIGTEIGFDLEAARDPAPLEVADRHFARLEVDWLSALPPRARHDKFYALWTLKEAFVKALGLGLNLPLDAFCIAFSPDGSARLGPSAAVPEGGEAWALRSWRQGEHWAGLAVKTAVRDVRIFSVTI